VTFTETDFMQSLTLNKTQYPPQKVVQMVRDWLGEFIYFFKN